VAHSPAKQERTQCLRALVRAGGAACAPMAGGTDRPFRRICRRMGSIYVTTEFISSVGLARGREKVRAMALYDEEERPLGIQLFGADPEAMAAGARAAAALEPDFIDINFGCPVRKVTRTNGGSSCMRDLGLMERIIRAVDEAVDLPVTVKIRAGWDEQLLNAPEAAQMAEAAGVVWVAVHGRTRAQLYTGRADLDIIRRTREAVAIPVIGNGDVVDGPSWQRMVDATGVDTVVVGRGAIGNPWIFGEIEAWRAGRPWQGPTLEDRIDLLLLHMEDKVAEQGPWRGIVAFRKQMSMYLRGLPNVAELRRELFALDEPAAVRALLEGYRGRSAA
jgi:tRNA-dihydrouridine synthase B